MAKAILGYPLLKGHGEVIRTAKLSNSPAVTLPVGGLGCLIDSTVGNDDKVCTFTEAGAKTKGFAGFLTSDIAVPKEQGQEAIVSVVSQAYNLPVRMAAGKKITSTLSVGLTAKGEVIMPDDALCKFILDAQFASTEVIQAKADNGAEFETALINLYSLKLVVKTA